VADLDALAVLCGHHDPLHFPGSLRPDVARVDHRHASLFLADAKHSERPGFAATARRYDTYMDVINRWSTRGYTVTVAIGHAPSEDRWLRFVTDACARARLWPDRAGFAALAVDMAISWVLVSPARHIRPIDP
jgi:hypothetical protein